MADKKITQREYFNGLIAYLKGEETSFTVEDFVEFINGRIEVLDKKSTKTDSKKNAEVEANIALVFEALSATNGNVTVTELIKGASNEVAEWSGQKVSAYLSKLEKAGKVVKTTEKKVSRFKVVGE